jgi:hypothetical protein
MTDTHTRSRLGWSLVVVLALTLGGAALDLASRGANRAHNTTSIQSLAGQRLPIPSQALLVPGEQFATDSSTAGGSDLWAFGRVKSGLRVQHWRVNASTISPEPASLITSPPAGNLTVAVVPWREDRRALALVTQRGHSVAVQIRRYVPPFTVLARARTPVLPLTAGSTRSIFADGGARGPVRLIVVDRPVNVGGVMRIRVLTSATNFHSITRDVRLVGSNSFPIAAWNLVAGGVNSFTGDLLFISRRLSTSTGETEVHALLSSKKYNGYGTQTPIDNPEGAGGDWGYVLAHAPGGVPVLYGIDLTSRSLMRFLL